MNSLSLDIEDFFLLGRINIYPVPNTFTEEKSRQLYDLLLAVKPSPQRFRACEGMHGR